MPYICMTRSDVADGTLQVLDLVPNSSLRVPAIDLPGQTRYINRVTTDAVTVDTGVIYGSRTSENAIGLGAYIADCFDKVGAVLSTAEIADAMTEILLLLDGASTAMTQVNIENAVVTGANSNPIVGFQASANFDLEEMLKVLAGSHYVITKGTTLAVGTSQGVFTLHAPVLNIASAESVIKTESGVDYPAFDDSIASGELSELAQAITLYGAQTASDSATGYPARQHPSVARTDGLTPASARMVVVYDDDGTILV